MSIIIQTVAWTGCRRNYVAEVSYKVRLKRSIIRPTHAL